MLQEVVFIVDSEPAFLHPRNDRTVLGVGRMLEHVVQLEWEMMMFFHHRARRDIDIVSGGAAGEDLPASGGDGYCCRRYAGRHHLFT